MERNHTHSTPSSNPATTAPLITLFFVITSFVLWCSCVGACLARLWYYDGDLQKKFTRHEVHPHYIRERLAEEQGKKRRESQRVLDTARWNRDVATMSFEAVQEFDSMSLRERIFEEKRISRLPAFEQDDGGDGSEFPDMPVDMTAEEYNLHNFPVGDRVRDLGLRELGWDDWLSCHDEEQFSVRAELLDIGREECLQMRRGTENERLCGELWQEMAEFLALKYPSRFWEQRKNGFRKLWDDELQESHPLDGPFGILTLDTMARLIREDFCVFLKSPFSGQYTLLVSATCFPSGWRLRSRIGHSVDSQQDMVLPWEGLPEILSYVDKHPDKPPYKRHVAFIQTVHPHEPDLIRKYFVQEGKDFFSGNISFLRPEALHARIEKQMFRRLPKSGAIVMTTRVQVSPLVRMPEKKLHRLAAEIRSWPAHVARLKGRDLWARAVLGYIEEFPMAHDDRTVVKAGELTEDEEGGILIR
ncbi:hypothetical protein N0V90_011911 [Kalmusia sp. IMI 367209]|nr:hypothetical protein N0V90_011911 [Kalmusia sp. IMI 367209]